MEMLYVYGLYRKFKYEKTGNLKTTLNRVESSILKKSMNFSDKLKLNYKNLFLKLNYKNLLWKFRNH